MFISPGTSTHLQGPMHVRCPKLQQQHATNDAHSQVLKSNEAVEHVWLQSLDLVIPCKTVHAMGALHTTCDILTFFVVHIRVSIQLLHNNNGLGILYRPAILESKMLDIMNVLQQSIYHTLTLSQSTATGHMHHASVCHHPGRNCNPHMMPEL
jgi:hypothetical protein